MTKFGICGLVIYKSGYRVEIGKVKSVKGSLAYVWFGESDTATRCDISDLYHLRNAYMIRETGFDKPRKWRDDPASEKQLAMIRAMQAYCNLPTFDWKHASKGDASDYIEKYKGQVRG